MKPRMLLVALLAALGSACTSMDKPGAALRVEPIMAIRHGGPDGQAYYQLGRYYAGQRRPDLAEQAYLKAIAADDRHLEACDALARLYAEHGELARALPLFEKAAAIAPELAYIHNNLGFAYYLQGDFQKAYLAVSKALSLDPTLARGWANLERIAAASAAASLREAAREQGQEAPPARPDGFSARPESRPPAPSPASDAPAGDAPDGPRILSGKFTLVSTVREIVADGGSVKIEIFPEQSVGQQPIDEWQASLTTARIEVANGNGIGGFARKFGAQLRSKEVRVTRITNHASFSVATTEIQFAPRYEAAARTLAARFNLRSRLVAAPSARPGSDIRIVLGRDAGQSGWLAQAFAGSAKI